MKSSRVIDLSGQRFGLWTVLRYDEATKLGNGKPSFWICKCSCGIEQSVSANSLKHQGSIRCAACSSKLHEQGPNDLVGKRFGKLLVLGFEWNKGKNQRMKAWKCQCDCGHISTILHANLKRNKGGCAACRSERSGQRLVDLKGSHAGLLTYVEEAESTFDMHNRKMRRIKCQCACGKITIVLAGAYMSNKLLSCGCLRSSISRQTNTLEIQPGTKFNRLTVVSKHVDHSLPRAYFNCVCDCGNDKRVAGTNLRHGKVKSCGCLAREVSRARLLSGGIHGRST